MENRVKSQGSGVLFERGKDAIVAAIMILALLTPNARATIVNGVVQNGWVEDTDPLLSPLAGATVIDFDNVSAPCLFAQTVQLSELYAPMGVHFSRIGGNGGGAILNQCSSFGVAPVSGDNFLAFNRFAQLSNGAPASDPEKILFDTLMTEVSIYAAGGYLPSTFKIQAYDAADMPVDSDTITTTGWAPLTVSWGEGIVYVVLEESGGDDAFVYDNFSFTPIPEPTAILLLGLGTTALVRKRKA